jgi:3-oxoacyl-[acyl-carrier protein] reductase
MLKNKHCFKDKVVIITGAGQGMGKQVAIDMANEGAKVVASDIDKNKVDEVEVEIKNNGNNCISVKCDVSSRKEVDSLIQETVKTFGSVDILVNNAGLLTTGTIEEVTDELIDKTIDINLKGALYAIRGVTPIMKKNKYGRIINVASITAKRGDNTTVFVYGASKGALMTVTKSVARELGPYGITSNAVAPHAIMTQMMSYWDEDKKRSVAEKIPVKRLGTVQDVSNLIMFLASDESSFINGETININGGYYMD